MANESTQRGTLGRVETFPARDEFRAGVSAAYGLAKSNGFLALERLVQRYNRERVEGAAPAVGYGRLEWLNRLAQDLPDDRRLQVAQLLDLARFALGTGTHTPFAEIRILDCDGALKGLPITQVTP